MMSFSFTLFFKNKSPFKKKKKLAKTIIREMLFGSLNVFPFNISLHSLYLNSILFLFLLWYIEHSFSTLIYACIYGVNIPTMDNFKLPI